MRAGISAACKAPIKALARRLDDYRFSTALTLTPMGTFAQVSDSEMLLSPGKPAFWEAYPEMTFPKHHGFLQELSHESADAPIPNWMTIDSGAWAPPVRFARVNDAVLWLYEGVAMTAGGKILSESTFTLQERSLDLTALPGTQKGRTHIRLDRRNLQTVEWVDGPVLMPANGWNRAFGHWIYDTLTAVKTFIEPIQSGNLKLIFSELTSWQRTWLQLLGVSDDAIIEAGYGYVRAKHAIVPSTLAIQNVRYPGPHTVELINFLRALPQPSVSVSPYLYLSRLDRGQSSHRTLEHEDQIIAALTRLGFACVAPESLTPSEQIALFAKARVILGPVGSAFALSGLAAAGASIVEILPPPAAHSWIFRSSANFQHLYGCIMAEVIPESQRDLVDSTATRADWFYSYRAAPEIVAQIAERATKLSS
jgi:capsular polysaccharide biosynthesis protein